MLPLLLLFASTYSNSVLPGDYRDPGVIRRGGEYRPTATSSQWAPLFPLLGAIVRFDFLRVTRGD